MPRPRHLRQGRAPFALLTSLALAPLAAIASSGCGGTASVVVESSAETSVLADALSPTEARRADYEAELARVEARLTTELDAPERERQLRHRITLLDALVTLDVAASGRSDRAGASCDAYRALADAAPSAEDAADVLYGLAYAAERAGLHEDAAEAYRRIVRDHPGSRHHNWALVGLGKLAFDASDLATAEPLLRRASESPAEDETPLIATYYLGLIALDTERYDAAQSAFTRVAIEGARSGDALIADYAARAQHDLVRTIARARVETPIDAAAVHSLFGTVVDDDESSDPARHAEAVDALERELARRFYESSTEGTANANAMALAHDLAARGATGPFACRDQLLVVMTAWRAGDAETITRDANALVATYVALREREGPSGEHVAECRAAIAGSVVQLAGEFHRVGLGLPEGAAVGSAQPPFTTIDRPHLTEARALLAAVSSALPDLTEADYASHAEARHRPSAADVTRAIATIDAALATPAPRPARGGRPNRGAAARR